MFEVLSTIKTSAEIKSMLPLSDQSKAVLSDTTNLIKAVLSGVDSRKLLIIGPCSADSESAFYKFLEGLKNIEREVTSKLLIIPRLYTCKPRTRWDSYKGLLHTPDIASQKTDFEAGIYLTRKMFLSALSDFGFVCAGELLYLDLYKYLDDLTGYTVIGSRSSENQSHKLFASGLDIPVGFKNPMNGDLNAFCSIIKTAQMPNDLLLDSAHLKTYGNSFAHAILRGYVNNQGKNIPNYDEKSLDRLISLSQQNSIKNLSVIIDANHSNSNKDGLLQADIIFDTVDMLQKRTDCNRILKGFMVESYLKDGCQSMNGTVYGQSYTDSCLGLEKTRDLILRLADKI